MKFLLTSVNEQAQQVFFWYDTGYKIPLKTAGYNCTDSLAGLVQAKPFMTMRAISFKYLYVLTKWKSACGSGSQ